ncbi:Triacylglycerol lipase family,Lipase/vitellogenin,Alpha/Beta hydrolase fold [Cinara cedri]|uniref:Triacylglycerol lipase family,Lipase/vitellogenin,Alpha/Beta hydrolase fold n=1 Tax=Cinara cedri TaxID=506608 RepID=A0A5E4N269_9HEMI|nr:Triacylglycerol lipase family,Lipase/vitellogenin,Alpha/Beta hydrolase fold [Cinara cedri]
MIWNKFTIVFRNEKYLKEGTKDEKLQLNTINENNIVDESKPNIVHVYKFPVNMKVVKKVKFGFWTLLGRPESQVYFKNEETYKQFISVLKDKWKKGSPLKILIHGWLDRYISVKRMFGIKDSYVRTNHFNVITVVWQKLATDNNYSTLVNIIFDVGVIVGNFLSNLYHLNFVEPKDIHIIAHGFGAQIAGYSGYAFQFNTYGNMIDRITALDPPHSKIVNEESRARYIFRQLSKEDAKFVDVIHTSSEIIGIPEPLGHVDFYPNYGRSPQPGCMNSQSTNLQAKCSHQKSCEYYEYSVTTTNTTNIAYVECAAEEYFNMGICADSKQNFLGHHVDRKYAQYYKKISEIQAWTNLDIWTGGLKTTKQYNKNITNSICNEGIHDVKNTSNNGQLRRRKNNPKNERSEWTIIIEGTTNSGQTITTSESETTKECSYIVNPEVVDKVKFKYWEHENRPGEVIELENEITLKYLWKNESSLKVVIHGWRGSDTISDNIFRIKDTYVRTGRYNVISVSWEDLASKINYMDSAKMVSEVGIIVGSFLSNLYSLKLITPGEIQVIGHSLGAQIAGWIGFVFECKTKFKIDRITALDPAAPGFKSKRYIPNYFRPLTIDDAEFVDVIHTAIGILGIIEPVGHVDFYPNYGESPQPNCKNDIFQFQQIICSHRQSYLYYEESINNSYDLENNSYVKCSSAKEFKEGKCANSDLKNYLGHYADRWVTGKFYRNFNSRPFEGGDMYDSDEEQ